MRLYNLGVEIMQEYRRKLLLFLTDMRCLEKMPIMATLAWLTKRKGISFDSYISSGIIEKFGLKIDGFFFGDLHAEQFYYMCNIYDIEYCIYGKPQRFLEELESFNKKCITLGEPKNLPEFYFRIFNWYSVEIPKEAVIINAETIRVDKAEKALIGNYCYPDIYYREALGIHSGITEEDLKKFKEMGVESILTLYCEEKLVEKLKELGFKVRVIDHLRKEDTCGSVTLRVAERWLDRAKGFAVGDPYLAVFWLPFFCRKDLICLYDSEWKGLASIVSHYADKKSQTVIWGFQPSDDFITELSKFNKVMQIITYMRPLFLMEPEHKSSIHLWDATPWDKEYSNEELLKMAENRCIACSLLFFSENLCHSLIIPRIFELIKTTGIKVGVGTNVSWYEYASRWMKDILVPSDLGGCFPLVEPLLSSAGLGAATEAKGYISSETLLKCLKEARIRIAMFWGEKFIPIGYYPWQDSNPYYKLDTAEPQFEVIRKAGFKYYITCKDMNKTPKIVYRNEDFIVINQQNSTLDLLTYTEILSGRKIRKESAPVDLMVKVPWSYTPLADLKRWEKMLLKEGRPGWIIISMDSPFWGWSPFYFDRIRDLKSAIDYIRSGGGSGKLFPATPHEVARYAEILDSKDLL